MDTKEKILEAIKRAQAEGITLVWNDWGSVDDKKLCPIGCVLLDDNPENMDLIGDGEGVYIAAAILEVGETWVNSFIEGYDRLGKAEMSNVPDAWTVGHELHNQLNPETYGQLPKMMETKNDKRK